MSDARQANPASSAGAAESLPLRREDRSKLVSVLVRYILELEREEARMARSRRVGS